MSKRRQTQYLITYVVERPVRGYTRKDGRVIAPYTREVWVVREVERAYVKGRFAPEIIWTQIEEIEAQEAEKRRRRAERRAERQRIEAERIERISEIREDAQAGAAELATSELTGEPPATPPPTIKDTGVVRPGSPEWIPYNQYITELEDAYHLPIRVDDPIFRKKDGAVFVSRNDSLVWEYPLEARQESLIEMEFLAVVRIWALLFRSDSEEMFVCARSRSLRMVEGRQDTFAYAERIAAELYDQLTAEIKNWESKSSEYISPRGRIAWSLWYGGEKAPSKPMGGS